MTHYRLGGSSGKSANEGSERAAAKRQGKTTTNSRAVVLASADAGFRHRLGEVLRSQRWQVLEAGGGAEALAHLEQETPSVLALLLDSWLPDLEVGEFSAQLEKMYPALDVLRVDGLTAGLNAAQRDAARNPHRGELLYAMRQAQENDGPERTDDAAWNTAPAVVPMAGITAAGNSTSADAVHLEAAAKARQAAMEASNVIGENFETRRELSMEVLPYAAPFLPAEAMERGMVHTEDDHLLQPIAGLVGESGAMRELVRNIRAVAPRRTTVLLQGPTGSGKEVAAHALHILSTRRNRPFTVLNCAAIPESLLEAELFGHSRGAFTGAVTSRTGRIEAAHLGTLFLDEIGEMPQALQSKLLRFLENGELQRVGENENVRVDVRVIAATHQPLEEHIQNGRFRADLYHRIAVFPIWVPSLAERMEDLPLLAAHFLQRMGEEMPIKRLSLAAVQKLYRHHWPGNVRELAHVLERAVILAGSRAEIGDEHVRFSLERKLT